MKTSFKTRVSRMGVGSFVNINIFVMKYFFFSLSIIFIFFEYLKSKSTQLLGSQKANSGVSFNDTLLNFGLRQTFFIQMKYRLQWMFNHLVGRAGLISSPLYSILLGSM